MSLPGFNRSGIFLLLTAASILLSIGPLSRTAELSLKSDAHTHILLILPLCGALAFMQPKRALRDESQPVVGYVLLSAAIVIGAIAKWGLHVAQADFSLCLSMFALVTWWIGSLIICYGSNVVREYLFQLLLLYWLVPLPDLAVDSIVAALQILSAYAARILLVVGGIPVTQDGTLLSMASLDVDVAPQCSSIRSSLMLVITTMVLAHLFLRSTWRKALLIVAAIPVAALKNGLRIFTLVEIGTRFDPQIFDSDLHHRGGIVFFAVSVAITAGLLWMLRRTERVTMAS